ncbi:MAG: hypothetical protein V1918_10555 [Planctomycetota bacterium]
MGPKKTARLLKRVAFRGLLASFGRKACLFFVSFAAFYTLLLLVSRLLALIPDRFGLKSVLLVPLAALVAALVSARRPNPRRAARLVDLSMDTGDLFLTTAWIGSAQAVYKPLVMRRAEERAPVIDPRKVLPFHWSRKASVAVLAGLLLPVMALYLPQFDPLGREKLREEARARLKRLAESRKAVEERRKLVEQALTPAGEETHIQLALEKLAQDLNAMRKINPQANFERLAFQQKELGKLWRNLSERKLLESLDRVSSSQRFGGDLQKASQWRKDIQKGESAGLKDELKAMKELARKLEGMPDFEEKRRLQKELQERAKAMGDFMSAELNSKPLSNALQQALEQLGMCGAKGLSQDALQAFQESLDLTEIELQRYMDSLQDIESLETALSLIQLAKQLNMLENLDGQCPGGGGACPLRNTWRSTRNF